LCGLLEEQAKGFGCGAAVLDNIARLRRPETAVVSASLQPGLFGGPLSLWLKIFTAARLASWLSGQGLPAVPVGCISASSRTAGLTAGILTLEGPRRFAVQDAGDTLSGLIEEILGDLLQALGAHIEDSDTARILRSCYRQGMSCRQAWGECISNLLDFCGIILLDPAESSFAAWIERLLAARDTDRIGARISEQRRKLQQAGYGPTDGEESATHELSANLPSSFKHRLLLPAVAEIVDETDIFDVICGQAAMPQAGRTEPVAWPRSSATILSSRDRKVIERYGIDTKLIYKGSGFIVEKLRSDMNIEGAPMQLDDLESGIGYKLAQAGDLAGAGLRLLSKVEKSQGRMRYQVGKLRGGFSRAVQHRLEAMARQTAGLCDALAPWRMPQECALAGFQFIFRHSHTLPEELYRGLDIWEFEHQLIQF